MIPFKIFNKGIESFCLCFLLLAIIFLLNPETLSARGLKFKIGKDKSFIPFDYIDGHIILPFIIGNKKVKLILDTGSNGLVLFQRIGSYGLKPEPNKHVLFSGVGTDAIIKGKLYANVNVESKDIEGTGITVVIIPKNDVSIRLKNKVNGLIGYDLFSRFLVTIDYSKSRIILSHPKDFIPLGFYLEKELIILDSRPYLNFNLTIPGVDDIEHFFFIDTGAGFDLMLNSGSHSLKNNKIDYYLGSGLTGDIKGKFYWVHHIQFDDLVLNNFLISVPNSGNYQDKDQMKNRDGTLGGKFLQKFEKVVFDYSNSKIYFFADTMTETIIPQVRQTF